MLGGEVLWGPNRARAEEERRGIVRWLRPEFQNPGGERQREIEGVESPESRVESPKRKKGKIHTGNASGTRGGKKGRGEEPSPTCKLAASPKREREGS